MKGKWRVRGGQKENKKGSHDSHTDLSPCGTDNKHCRGSEDRAIPKTSNFRPHSVPLEN